MLNYKWQLRLDVCLWFLRSRAKDLLKNLMIWSRQKNEISDTATESLNFKDYLQRLMNKYDKPVQKIVLKLFVYFSEQFLLATYEICLADKVPFLIKVGLNLTKEEVGSMLWQIQGALIGKEIYPFGKEFPPLRNFVIGVRNITLQGGLERFHDAKLSYDILKECCLILGIPAVVLNELWSAVDATMTESIPLTERIVTFNELNKFIEAVAAREP